MKIIANATFYIHLDEAEQFEMTVTEGYATRRKEVRVVVDTISSSFGGQVVAAGFARKKDGTIGGSRRTQRMDVQGLPERLQPLVAEAFEEAQGYERHVEGLTLDTAENV